MRKPRWEKPGGADGEEADSSDTQLPRADRASEQGESQAQGETRGTGEPPRLATAETEARDARSRGAEAGGETPVAVSDLQNRSDEDSELAKEMKPAPLYSVRIPRGAVDRCGVCQAAIATGLGFCIGCTGLGLNHRPETPIERLQREHAERQNGAAADAAGGT